MSEIEEPLSNSDIFPQTDLAANVAEGLLLPLQNRDIFSALHIVNHRNNRLFAIGHSAIELSANAVFEDRSHVEAMLLGCGIFEAFSYASRPESYSDNSQLAAVYQVTRRFTDQVRVADFAARAEYAAWRLRCDSPILHDAISEVAARNLSHNNLAVVYAVAGAGMLRGMQIRADRALAA